MAKERLEVELVAQAQQAINELQKYVKATGQATKEIGEHAKQAKTASEKVGSLTKAIKNYWLEILVAVAAVRKMAQMAGEFIAASNEQERVVSHLNSTLQATGRLTPTIVQSMTDWAGAMQKVTAYSDETIINAQAVLAVYDDIATETFPDVIKAAMDLSTIMGVDLTEATRSLAIALTDPEQGLTRLRRAGILFTDGQKEAIVTMGKTGDSLRAQAMILDVVKGKVGGAAEAYGKTLAGQMDITQQTMDELKETLGDLTKTWMPGFIMEANVMLAVLNRITTAIMGTKTENEKFRESIKGMTKEDLKESITQYDKMIQTLANQMAPLDAIIAKNKWLTKEYREAGKQLDVLGPQYKDATLRYYMLQEALKQYAQTHPVARKETENTTKAIKEAKQATEDYVKTWDEWQKTRFGERSPATEGGFGEIVNEEDITRAEDYAAAFASVAGPLVEELTVAQTAMEYFKNYIANDFQPSLVGAWETIWTSSGSTFGKIKDAIKDMITTFIKGLAKQYAVMAIVAAFSLRFGQAAKYLAASAALYAAAGAIQSLQQGGIVRKQVGGSMYGDRQPAMLEHGERVIPKETASRNAAALNRMEAGEGGGAPVNIYLGGKLLYSTMQRAFRNGQIVVDARAIR